MRFHTSNLADGWKRLRLTYPDRLIVIHLIISTVPSVSDSHSVPAGEVPPTPRHFAAFMEQVWLPAREGRPHTPWSTGRLETCLEALQVACGLPNEDFQAFIQDCESEFGYRLPEFKEIFWGRWRSYPASLE